VLKVTKTCTIWSPQILWQPKQHLVTIAIDNKNYFGCHVTINNKIMVKYGTLWHGFNVYLGDISYFLSKEWGKFNKFFGFKCEFNQIVATQALGSQPKQRACKGAGQK
jgi:hypothetical protein